MHRKKATYQIFRPGGVLPLFLLALLLVLPVSASAQTIQRGCDMSFLDLQRRMAEVDLSRYVAMIEELSEQPPSTMQLTCFQSALGEATKSGGIFSDANNFSLTTLASDTLANALEGVTSTTVGDWLNCNFQGSLLQKASSVIVGALSNTLGSLISSCCGGLSALIGNVLSALNSLNYACTVVQDLWNDVIGQLTVNLGVDALTMCMIQSGAFGSAGPKMAGILNGSTAQNAINGMMNGPGGLNNLIPGGTGLNSFRPQLNVVKVGNTKRPSIANFQLAVCGGVPCPPVAPPAPPPPPVNPPPAP